MDVKTLVANFETIAEAPGGVDRLREFILQLAVQGKLVEQYQYDEQTSLVPEASFSLLNKQTKKKVETLPHVDSSSISFDIPKSWFWIRLGRATVSMQNGLSKRKGTSGEDTVVLRLADISEGRELHLTEPRSILLTSEERDKYCIVAGDILVIRVNGSADLVARFIPIRKTEKHAYCDHFIRVRPNGRVVDQRFLVIAASNPFARRHFEKVTVTTAGQRTINQTGLSLLPLALPPIAEQKRIVAKVDELMTLCDQLQERRKRRHTIRKSLQNSALHALTNADSPKALAKAWKRINTNGTILTAHPDSVHPLRQAIVQLAVQGNLVEQKAGDNAGKLLSRISRDRKNAISSKIIKPSKDIRTLNVNLNIPKTWSICYLDDIAAPKPNAVKAGPFGSSLTKSCYVTDGYKVYGQQQVIAGDENYGDYFINEEKFRQLQSCKIAPGDVLISLMGTIGKVLVLSDNPSPGIINPRLLKVSLHPLVYAHYFKLYLESPIAVGALNGNAVGETMANLNLKILRGLPIPIPPLAEQKQIVAKVENLMSYCDELEASLRNQEQTSIQLAAAMVQSLSS